MKVNELHISVVFKSSEEFELSVTQVISPCVAVQLTCGATEESESPPPFHYALTVCDPSTLTISDLDDAVVVTSLATRIAEELTALRIDKLAPYTFCSENRGALRTTVHKSDLLRATRATAEAHTIARRITAAINSALQAVQNLEPDTQAQLAFDFSQPSTPRNLETQA